MAQFPALNLWTDAWLADTGHLTRVERDIYFHLLILMWRTPKCRVPNEIDWIMRKLACTADEQIALEMIVREFCKSTGNWITQKRLTKEYLLATKRSKNSSASAKRRWHNEKTSCDGNASTTTTTTIITKEEPPYPPRGEGEQGKGFLNVRRKRYSIRDSFNQAVEHIEARRCEGGDKGSADDLVLLPGLREGAA